MSNISKRADKVTRAFVYEIQANSVDSHQTSGGYVLTFLRFNNRDPFSMGNDIPSTSVRKPLVVVSDAVNITYREQKSSNNKSIDIQLKAGDVNYMAAVAPGDYLLVNLLETQELITSLAVTAEQGGQINGIDSGFKGVFRVQSVHNTHVIDPESGAMTLGFAISAFTHTELNDVIYFNPYLVTQGEQDNDILFLTSISNTWNKLIGNKQINSVQNVMTLLFQAFLGNGLNQQGRQLKGSITRTENNLYLLPQGLGKMLGHPNARTAADLIAMYFGIQQFGSSTRAQREVGLNPSISTRSGMFFYSGPAIRGQSYNKPEFWNQIPVGQILKSYLNDVVNEMYTTLKPDPDNGGALMPAIVVRQKPFTSEGFSSQINSTKFLTLPRWRIHPDRIKSFHIGRDDAARINFVQVFGKSQAFQGAAQGASIDYQISQGNYAVDRDDVKRSGLRPYITTSNFDYPSDSSQSRLSQAPIWAQLVADWVIGGHLKLSGSVELSGISDPITVGDNAQIDGVVFHIEGVVHTMSLDAQGRKNFSTTLNLSSGVPSEAYQGQGIYAEMNQTTADAKRKWIGDQNLDTLIQWPGASDTQDVPGRQNGEKTSKIGGQPFSPEATDSTSPPNGTAATIQGGGTKTLGGK